MHGKSEQIIILNLTPMSEEDQEQDRLRDAAFHSQKITSGEYSLDDYDCPSGSRSPDDVLSDSMGGGDESMLFDMSTMPRFARAMGASEDEIAQMKMQLAEQRGDIVEEPASLSSFKRDYADFQKFGGDTVAMELAREDEKDEMSESYMDDMLGFSMDSPSNLGQISLENEAISSIQEQFGRDARAVFHGEADGVGTFMVDSPETGPVKYVYDSSDGVGSMMRGE